jgi:phosphoglycolate phosphatase
MTIKAILFDLDDTLRGTFVARAEMHRQNARKLFGYELEMPEILEHWGEPLETFWRNIYHQPDLSRERLFELIGNEVERFPIEIFTGANEIVKEIRAQEIITGILTSSTSEVVHAGKQSILPQLDLFDYMQTADMTDFHKPDARVFNPALEFLSGREIAPHETLYVGDGLLDGKAAQAAGLQFIGVKTGPDKGERLRRAGFTVIENVNLLPEHLGLDSRLA